MSWNDTELAADAYFEASTVGIDETSFSTVGVGPTDLTDSTSHKIDYITES